ncbi:MAG: endopeptidase La [bacterium]|nr:endopeptidase La [bacterium]
MVKTNQPQPKRFSLPLAPIREGMLFPHNEVVYNFGRSKSVMAVESSFNTNRLIFLTAQKDPTVSRPTPDHLYQLGVIGRIENVIKTERDLNVFIKGLYRAKIIKWHATEPFFLVDTEVVNERVVRDEETLALMKYLLGQFREILKLGKQIDVMVSMRLMSTTNPAEFADQLAFFLDINHKERQQLLEELDVKNRLVQIAKFISREIQIAEIEKKIVTKTQEKMSRSMREVVLRERKKTIEKELNKLGAEVEEDEGIGQLKAKLKKAGMPKDTYQKCMKEFKRLKQMPPMHPEHSYIRTYLEIMAELPWGKETPDSLVISKAKKILDEDHYGLEEVKERILEHLAVMKLKKNGNSKKAKDQNYKPTILCFVGPPGVGKTSVGRSIARALGRKFVRVSLGGVKDEAEIRGHRRTYVGAMPGRIVQAIRSVGTRNPVIMLDEVDKLGTDFRGDPSSALLEVLDPEQNKEFVDHYVDAPFDLSKVMFVCTANVLDTVPPALRDRLEVIRFPGYTEDEKLQIAKRYLVPKQLKNHGLTTKDIVFSDKILREIIRYYTREAGVRELERQIAKIMRKIARRKAENKKYNPQLTLTAIHRMLGPRLYNQTLPEQKNMIGIATGLAWTSSGGEILFIEVTPMPGKGNLILTGQLGDVMRESGQAALSYVRSRWQELGLKKNFYQEIDLHIHVPEGAVPKDGPSAGVAIATAIVSALTKIPVKKDVGMTGEITLRGRVLEIGGVKEKVIAAHRAGLKTIILPKDNKKNLIKVQPDVKKALNFKFVTHMDQVLKEALTKPIKLPRAK